jgi:hypothetical protein
MYLFQITCFKLVMKIELLQKCIENEQNNLKKKNCASLNPFSNFLPKFISINHVPPLVDFFFYPFPSSRLSVHGHGRDKECGPKVVHSA